jgi:hypothetical protein
LRSLLSESWSLPIEGGPELQRKASAIVS